MGKRGKNYTAIIKCSKMEYRSSKLYICIGKEVGKRTVWLTEPAKGIHCLVHMPASSEPTSRWLSNVFMVLDILFFTILTNKCRCSSFNLQ